MTDDTTTYRDTYFGSLPRDQALVRIARIVYLDRETSSEREAWLGLSDWEKRHYSTRALELLRERGRLQ